jgi:DNA invertase Pin-like site-specific DNA recombinase
MRRLSEAERRFIRDWYRADDSRSVAQACALMGVPDTTMRRILKPVIRPQGGRDTPGVDDVTLRELRDRGLTLMEIASRVGLNFRTVHRRLNRSGARKGTADEKGNG